MSIHNRQERAICEETVANVVVIGDSHAYHTFAGVNIPGVTMTSVVLPITMCSVLRDRPTFEEHLQRADVALFCIGECDEPVTAQAALGFVRHVGLGVHATSRKIVMLPASDGSATREALREDMTQACRLIGVEYVDISRFYNGPDGFLFAHLTAQGRVTDPTFVRYLLERVIAS